MLRRLEDWGREVHAKWLVGEEEVEEEVGGESFAFLAIVITTSRTALCAMIATLVVWIT